MKLEKCPLKLSLGSLILAMMLLFFFSCDKGPKPLGTQDTVKFFLNFNAGGNSYLFNLKPGNSEASSASQIYKTSGSEGTDIKFVVGFINRYVELIDNMSKVSVKIGFSYIPDQTIISYSSDKCSLLEGESDKYFIPKSYPICSSYGSGDFLSCSNATTGDFFFQVEFDDLANGKTFKSGIQQATGSFFRIDKIEKLHFVDNKSSTGSFDWVIQGEFNITMQAYTFGVADSPNAEVLKMGNSQFKLGLKNLCQ